MPQSRERRIYLTWKAEKKTRDYRNGPNDTLRRVADRFKIPVTEVRDIIEAQRGHEPDRNTP